ncbi:unnamed protein product [Peniophora sp. CBMAI 1063]|nr:unnamed protein product [Peniophora sp. CBMAI 1063]
MVLINENGDTTTTSSTPVLVAPCSTQQLDWNFGIEPYRLSITVNSTSSTTMDLVSSYTLQEYNWTIVQPVGSTNQITLYDRTGFIGTTDLYQVVSDGRDPTDTSCLSTSSSASTSATSSSTSSSASFASSTIPTSSSTATHSTGNTRSSSSPSTAAIAGGAAGGGIIVTIIFAVLICLWRRRRRARNRVMEIDPGDEGLPTYAEVVMPIPTPLTRSTSQSELASTLVTSPGASGKRAFGNEKRSALHSDFSPGDASLSPDTTVSESSASTMQIRNPDAKAHF